MNKLARKLVSIVSEYLGPIAEELVKRQCERISISIEDLTEEHIPRLAEEIEEAIVLAIGVGRAKELRGMIIAVYEIRRENELAQKLIVACSKHFGQLTEQFLAKLCVYAGTTLDTLTKNDLPKLAEVIEQNAELIIGKNETQNLKEEILRLGQET